MGRKSNQKVEANLSLVTQEATTFPEAGSIKGGDGISKAKNWGHPERRSWGHDGP